MSKIELYNEDCLITMSKMKNDSIDCIITSPPYNINLRVHSGKYIKRSVKEYSKYEGMLNDSLSMEEYFEWQKEVISEMLRVCNGFVFYNIQLVTGNKVALLNLLGFFSNEIKEIIIWDKKHSEPAISDGVLNSEYEFVIVFDKNKAINRQFQICNFKRGTLSNIFRIPKNSSNEQKNHQAAFPRELPFKLIQNFTNEQDTVYDPFMGTATCGIACLETNRNFIGSELIKEYFDNGKKRLENHQAQGTLFDPKELVQQIQIEQ